MKRICAVLLIVLLLANLILFPLGYVPVWSFWLTIAVVGLFAYYVLPRL